MSTKLSGDLDWSRPSTRLHAPPGGSSSISFGEDPPVKKPTAPVTSTQTNISSNATNSSLEKSAIVIPGSVVLEPLTVKHPFKVVIVAATNGAPELVSIVTKALQDVGIVNVSVTETSDAINIPFICQAIAGSYDGIFAAGVVLESGHLSLSISSALLQAGVASKSPIIPGIIEAKTLLEAKVLFKEKAGSWAASLLALLSIKSDKKNVPVASAPVVEPSFKPIEVAKQTSVAGLIAAFRTSLKEHGANGIFGIARKFRIMDDDNSKTLSLEEFKKAIQEHSMGWTDAQVKQVFDFFDRDHNGNISYEEFLRGARDPLSARRKQFVFMAFELLDTDKSGVIEPTDLMGKYDASKHPDVLSGARTQQEVLRDFLDTFDGGVKDGKVTPEEFMEYYTDVSASIDDDDYFELMMRNAWHISGGEGWCANSSNRRVLVIHEDGRQSVEEIKNDLGIGPNDIDAMIANLKAQGISDIKGISAVGSCDVESGHSVVGAKADDSRPPAAAAKRDSAEFYGNPQKSLQSSFTFG